MIRHSICVDCKVLGEPIVAMVGDTAAYRKNFRSPRRHVWGALAILSKVDA